MPGIALGLFEGRVAGEIGDQLGITRNNMKTHLRRLFAKLGISRRPS
jgi:DNA-binding CsgD family transcriptional regulator